MLYSLENCSVIPSEENRKIAYTKQQRRIIAINKTDEISFHSVSEASRALNIKRPTLITYLKTGSNILQAFTLNITIKTVVRFHSFLYN